MSVIANIHMESDLSEWTATVTDSGDLSWSASAGLAGTSGGLACLVDDTTAIYATKSGLNDTSNKVRIRFYLDPNSCTMTDPTQTAVLAFYNTALTVLGYVRLVYSGNSFRLNVRLFNDAGSGGSSTSVAISDGPHYIELYAQRAATSSSADGSLAWWIDGTAQTSLTGVDNYDAWAQVGAIRAGVGMVTGVPSGMSGTIYIDEILANNDGSEIGAYVTTATLTAGSASAGGQTVTVDASGGSGATATMTVGTADAVGQTATVGAGVGAAMTTETASASGLTVAASAGAGATLAGGTAGAVGLDAAVAAGVSVALSPSDAAAGGQAVTVEAGVSASATMTAGEASAAGLPVTSEASVSVSATAGDAPAAGQTVTVTATGTGDASVTVGIASAAGQTVTVTAGVSFTATAGDAPASGLAVTVSGGSSASVTLTAGEAAAGGQAAVLAGGALAIMTAASAVAAGRMVWVGGAVLSGRTRMVISDRAVYGIELDDHPANGLSIGDNPVTALNVEAE